MTGVRAYRSIDVAWQRLAEFLGGDYDSSLTDYHVCCEYVEAEFARLRKSFYHRSVGYLYELTHFHFSSYKDPFFDVVEAAMSGLGLSSVADVPSCAATPPGPRGAAPDPVTMGSR